MAQSATPPASDADGLPAWGIDRDTASATPLTSVWPIEHPREWAWGGSRGERVRVCIIDSGVDAGHPAVGEIQGAVVVEEGETLSVAPDDAGDLFGHGTACAGIVRAIAPACEIHSVRVLGDELTGGGSVLLAGLRWAIEQGFEVINLSLSTTRAKFVPELHELADQAYFRNCLLVASAHNMPVESFPWRFAAVVSVGSHAGSDPLEFLCNPAPPVVFAAPGVDVEVAWLAGSTIRASGNSFAAPHIAGIAALILGKHPGMAPADLKSVLRLTASNVVER